MPTEVKVGALLDAMPALREFSALDVPVKTGFKIQRIIKRIQTDVDAANESRKKIIDKFTEKDAEGKPVHPVDEAGKPKEDQVKLTDPDAYRKELKELFDQDVKFGFDKLHPEELGEKVSVRPAVLLTLDWLFTE